MVLVGQHEQLAVVPGDQLVADVHIVPVCGFEPANGNLPTRMPNKIPTNHPTLILLPLRLHHPQPLIQRIHRNLPLQFISLLNQQLGPSAVLLSRLDGLEELVGEGLGDLGLGLDGDAGTRGSLDC